MVPELEKIQKPRITEIQVRMDCNGCIQKIKKALHGINGIYDLYIDFPNQKLTIIGWADPEKIIKAIKKTRKIATICSHIEPSDPPTQPAEPPPPPPPEGGGQPPAPDAANPPPTETPTAAAAPPPPAEPPKDPPPPANPPPEVTPSPVATETAAPQQAPRPKDVEEIHIIHHHSPEYGPGYSYGGHWSNYPSGQGFRPEPPVYFTHSYDTYKPSPSITAFEYVRSPPRHIRYSRPENYGEDYHKRGNSNGNNITSMFSDENPNACRIV